MNVVIDVTEIDVREILMVNDPFYFFFISILSLKIENLSRLNEEDEMDRAKNSSSASI